MSEKEETPSEVFDLTIARLEKLSEQTPPAEAEKLRRVIANLAEIRSEIISGMKNET